MKLKNGNEKKCTKQNKKKTSTCSDGLKNLKAVDLLSVEEMHSDRGAKGAKSLGSSTFCYFCMAEARPHK